MARTPLQQLRESDFDYWKASHLLCRAGFGGTPEQVRGLANLGLEKAVEYIVDFEKAAAMPVDAGAFDRDIMRPATDEEREEFARARRGGNEAVLEQLRQRRQQAERADRQQVAAMQRWWMKRMIETPRPLEEKMTLFWHGHFATGYRKIEDSYHMFQQNQMFRTNAVGSFRTLTHGIIRDPAMIRYLDNQQNRAQAPNENLARELMELFTLGEGNEYSERDIKEGARALTGYTFQDDHFVFAQRQHDGSNKHILGETGRWNGEDFVNIILSKTICSEFICWKLYRFFINDEPGEPSRDGQAFVRELAKKLRENGYSLKPVLRAIFLSQHFYDERNLAGLIKSPVQLIVQAVRTLRTPARSLAALSSATDLMGQDLFFPPSVKGWDGGRSWINTSTFFVRQNTLIYLLTGRRPDAYPWDADGAPFDATHLIEHLSGSGESSAEEAVRYLLRFTLGRPPHEERVATLTSFVRDHGGTLHNDMLIAVLALITAMPEYQLC